MKDIDLKTRLEQIVNKDTSYPIHKIEKAIEEMPYPDVTEPMMIHPYTKSVVKLKHNGDIDLFTTGNNGIRVSNGKIGLFTDYMAQFTDNCKLYSSVAELTARNKMKIKAATLAVEARNLTINGQSLSNSHTHTPESIGAASVTDLSALEDKLNTHAATMASSTVPGHVMVDGTTVVINNGVISAVCGGKGPAAATVVVAAANSSERGKEGADYVCDGVNDEAEINTALEVANQLGGGMVLLLEGTFNVGRTIRVPSNTTLAGQGLGTVIKLQDNAKVDIINNYNTTRGNTKITVRDLTIDGNMNNNSGVYYSSIGFSNVMHLYIVRVRMVNCYGHGFYLTGCSHGSVDSCYVYGNGGSGIYLYDCGLLAISNNYCSSNIGSGIIASVTTSCTLTNNICTNNRYNGIYIATSDNNIVANNVVRGNKYEGIALYDYTWYCVVTGNTSTLNGANGIYLSGNCWHNIVTGNLCAENNQNGYTGVYGSNIYLSSSSSYNNIQNNICRAGERSYKPRYGIAISSSNCNGNMITNNDLYSSGTAGALYNSGTNTITSAGNRT